MNLMNLPGEEFALYADKVARFANRFEGSRAYLSAMRLYRCAAHLMEDAATVVAVSEKQGYRDRARGFHKRANECHERLRG